ncbi:MULTISPECIES: MerR family transcriptional regulator [Microbacterium]|uniref:MerR family transcriptional regulator n=1 Tax=Microbacterium barkeri TaxID=33917 RepID=A0A9W6LW35_9MICO|nr:MULTISPECIES: MerR family transcriptional regulator [Microbacterium]MDR6877605.1 DNA-binding transcriptional MerR regulator [Microbacterium barkeri]WRH16112.1 MerR family transcriptional regulator [Microbacterium sp. JZ37]GLJ60760.1 MerR family transcriptional regulator [Microbacterium barkeri]
MAESGMMHIGELAERTGLSLRTIRHYDEVGLVKPSGRSEGGFRQYDADDLSRLMLIRRMKPLGYTLEEMAELLAVIDARQGGDSTPESDAALERFREDAAARRRKLAEQLAMADEFIAQLEAR